MLRFVLDFFLWLARHDAFLYFIDFYTLTQTWNNCSLRIQEIQSCWTWHVIRHSKHMLELFVIHKNYKYIQQRFIDAIYCWMPHTEGGCQAGAPPPPQKQWQRRGAGLGSTAVTGRLEEGKTSCSGVAREGGAGVGAVWHHCTNDTLLLPPRFV